MKLRLVTRSCGGGLLKWNFCETRYSRTRCLQRRDVRESFARRRHIITENARVLKARDALLQWDLEQFGRVMAEAHLSMRDDFAMSCKEVDTVVEIATWQEGCWGLGSRGAVSAVAR